MNLEQNLTYCSGYPAYVIAPTDIAQAYEGVRRKEIIEQKLQKGSKISWYGATQTFDLQDTNAGHGNEFTDFALDAITTEDLGRISTIHTLHEGSACYLKKLEGKYEQISDSLRKRGPSYWDPAENLGQIYLSWDISGEQDVISEIYVNGYTTGISGRIHSVELLLMNGRCLKICGDVFHPYNSRVRIFPPQNEPNQVEPRVLIGIECLTCMEERRFYGGISMIKFGLAKVSDVINATPQEIVNKITKSVRVLETDYSENLSLAENQEALSSFTYAISVPTLNTNSDEYKGFLTSNKPISFEYPVLTSGFNILKAQPLPDGERTLLLVTENQESDLIIVVWNCVQSLAQQFLFIPDVIQDETVSQAVIDFKHETVLFYFKYDIMMWKLDINVTDQYESKQTCQLLPPFSTCKSKDLHFLHRGDWTFGLMLGLWHFYFDMTISGDCMWHTDDENSSGQAQLLDFEQISDTYLTQRRLDKFSSSRCYSSIKGLAENSKPYYLSKDSMYTCLITKQIKQKQIRFAHICKFGEDERMITLHLCEGVWHASLSPDNKFIVLWRAQAGIIRIVNLLLMSDEFVQLPQLDVMRYICMSVKSIVAVCEKRVYLISLESAGITHELQPFWLNRFDCSVTTVPGMQLEEMQKIESSEQSYMEQKHILVWDSHSPEKNIYMWMLSNFIMPVDTPQLIMHVPFTGSRRIRGAKIDLPILPLSHNRIAITENTYNMHNATVFKTPTKQLQFYSDPTSLKQICANQLCRLQVHAKNMELQVCLYIDKYESNRQTLKLQDMHVIQDFQVQTSVEGSNMVMHVWLLTRQGDQQSDLNREENFSEEESSLLIPIKTISSKEMKRFLTLENKSDELYWYKIMLNAQTPVQPTVEQMYHGQLSQVRTNTQQRYACKYGHSVCALIVDSVKNLSVNLFYNQKCLELQFYHPQNLNSYVSQTVQQVMVKISENSTPNILDCTLVLYVGCIVQLWHVQIEKNSEDYKELQDTHYVVQPGYAYGITMELAYLDIGQQFLDYGKINQPYLVELCDSCKNFIIFTDIEAHDSGDQLKHQTQHKQHVHCISYYEGEMHVFAEEEVTMDERPILNFQVDAKFSCNDWQVMMSALQGQWRILRGSIVDHGNTSLITSMDINTQFKQYNMLHLISSKYIGVYNQTGEYTLNELTTNQVLEKRLEFDIGPEGYNFFNDSQGLNFSVQLSSDKKSLEFFLLGNQQLGFLVLSPQHDSRNIGNLLGYFRQHSSENQTQIQLENLKTNNLDKMLRWLEKKQISYVQAVTQESLDKQNMLIEILCNSNAPMLNKVVTNLEDVFWLAILPIFTYGNSVSFIHRVGVAPDEAFHGETFKILLAWFFGKVEENFEEKFVWNIAPGSVAKVVPLIWQRLVSQYPHLAFQVVSDPQLMPSLRDLNPYSFHRLAIIPGNTKSAMCDSLAPIPTTLWKETITDSIEVQAASACVILFQGAHQSNNNGLMQPLLNSNQGYERAYDLPAVRAVIQFQSQKYGRFLLLPEALMFLVLLFSFHVFALEITYLGDFPASWDYVTENFTYFILTALYSVGNTLLLVYAIHLRYQSQASRQIERGSRGKWHMANATFTLLLGYAAIGLQILYIVTLRYWVALLQCAVLVFRYGFMEIVQASRKGIFVHYSNPWNYLDAFAIMTFAVLCSFYLADWHDAEEFGFRKAFVTIVAIEQLALTFKLLSFLRGFKTFGPTIQMIFEVFKDSRYFIMLLGIITGTFAIIFVVLFGTETKHLEDMGQEPVFEVSYRSLFDSFIATLSLAVANINLPDFTDSMFNYITGPLFVIFILLVHIVLFNLLVAILSSAYEKIRADEQARFLGGQAAIIDDLLASSSFTNDSNSKNYLHILMENLDALGQSDHDEWLGITNWMRTQLTYLKTDFKQQMSHQQTRSQKFVKGETDNLECAFSEQVSHLRLEFQQQLHHQDERMSQKFAETMKKEFRSFMDEIEQQRQGPRGRRASPRVSPAQVQS